MGFQNTKLNGVDLDNVEGFTLEVDRAEGAHGRPNPLAEPGKATLTRDVTDDGVVEGFDLATNGNGARRYVNFETEETNAAGKVVYTHKLVDAYVSKWSFQTRRTAARNGQQLVRYFDVIELSFGKYEGHSGGGNVSYENAEFGKRTGI